MVDNWHFNKEFKSWNHFILQKTALQESFNSDTATSFKFDT